MDYKEAIKYIHTRPKLAKKLGNDSLYEVLNLLGNSQDKLKYIHIAGTNGKGSAAAMLNSILIKSGYNVGMFTSPFIEIFNERIQISGNMISNSELAYYTQLVKSVLDEKGIELSEFALIFVIAVLYFSDKKCEIVILEVGLGGRLDATNAIKKSVVSLIMKIGLDHMEYLGDTKAEIAAEKCGIIKDGGAVITYPCQDKEVLDVIKKHCNNKNAKLIVPNESIDYDISLVGNHQRLNATCVVEAVKILNNSGFIINEDDLKYGLLNTSWLGRCEWLSDKLLIDGCHNEDGALAFAEVLRSVKVPITIVFAAMSDKEVEKIARIISEEADTVITTTLDMPRALSETEAASVFNRLGKRAMPIKSFEEAVNTALKNDGICAVCGSLYLIGEVRKIFKRKCE